MAATPTDPPMTKIPDVTDQKSALDLLEDRDDYDDSDAVIAAVKAWARKNGDNTVMKAVNQATFADRIAAKKTATS